MTRLVLDPARFPRSDGAQVRLSGGEHHYLARVLRHSVGDVVILLDGRGHRTRARVVAVDGEGLVLAAEGAAQAVAPAPAVTLLIGVLKGDKLDLVVQKAVELGARRVVPVLCERSISRPDDRRGRQRLERWERIARGAAQQCGRADVPEIAPIRSLASALQELHDQDGALRLMPYEGALWRPLRELLPETGRVQTIDVLVGPEGGFCAEEVAQAMRGGFLPCGLGPRILRAETAAIAVLAVLTALLDTGAGD